MNFRSWSKSSVDYGRKLVNSGLEGARSGGETFLHGRSLTPFLNESARNALGTAFIGACIGVLGGYPGNGGKHTGRVLALGLLGGAIGFGAGVAWESRYLAESVAFGALKNLSKVRDEHWLEKNPIDYA